MTLIKLFNTSIIQINMEEHYNKIGFDAAQAFLLSNRGFETAAMPKDIQNGFMDDDGNKLGSDVMKQIRAGWKNFIKLHGVRFPVTDEQKLSIRQAIHVAQMENK